MPHVINQVSQTRHSVFSTAHFPLSDSFVVSNPQTLIICAAASIAGALANANFFLNKSIQDIIGLIQDSSDTKRFKDLSNCFCRSSLWNITVYHATTKALRSHSVASPSNSTWNFSARISPLDPGQTRDCFILSHDCNIMTFSSAFLSSITSNLDNTRPKVLFSSQFPRPYPFIIQEYVEVIL